uniref:WW domain containing E3 ubiquitin protein ligase 2 n=1 Tax=Rattus norvegicus TaxID=10116 RepID=A0A8I5ZP91_RAT|eukprot:XP_008770782.1 PREDICTED: NEDD4-like E3 ubiquitin-protein ligase WWP2 isoform X1 [Rattus norvegicus]
MASASSSRAGVALPFEKSQLTLRVVSAKPKVHNRQPRINSYVEVAVDGLPSETKKTGKRIGSSELLWNEVIVLNVTAQSHLDLKVWSCHTLRNELLGTASVNLSNVLKNNGGKSLRKLSALAGEEVHLFFPGCFLRLTRLTWK